MKLEFFLQKLHVCCMKMIKNILFKVISIAIYTFITFPEGDECHANKTVRLLNQTSYPAIFVRSEALFSESVAQ